MDKQFRVWYDSYLASPAWKAVRETRLRKDRNKCRGCGSTENLHVHHITYERFTRENQNDQNLAPSVLSLVMSDRPALPCPVTHTASMRHALRMRRVTMVHARTRSRHRQRFLVPGSRIYHDKTMQRVILRDPPPSDQLVHFRSSELASELVSFQVWQRSEDLDPEFLYGLVAGYDASVLCEPFPEVYRGRVIDRVEILVHHTSHSLISVPNSSASSLAARNRHGSSSSSVSPSTYGLRTSPFSPVSVREPRRT